MRGYCAMLAAQSGSLSDQSMKIYLSRTMTNFFKFTNGVMVSCSIAGESAAHLPRENQLFAAHSRTHSSSKATP